MELEGGDGFDDLHILSIPAFVWFKDWPTSPGISSPHHSLTCNIINGTQMIVMGGTFPNSSMCDIPTTYGQHNVDLGRLNTMGDLWQGFRNDNPPYLVPPEIVEIVGGTYVFEHFTRLY